MRFPQRVHRSSRTEVLLCRRCQKPGFARECDGERVLPPSLDRRESPSTMRAGQTFSQPMEN